MTTFLTLAHQKGGVGKSTLALFLSGYFRRAGLNTVVVDIDPQGTLTAFAELDQGRLALINRKDFSDFSDLVEKTKGFDLVVIDTPPYLSKELEEIFRITNFLLIPCKASIFDAMAIRQTLEFVEEAKKHTQFLCAIVLTMVISSSNLDDQVREFLSKYGFPVLDSEIGNRTAFVKSLAMSGNIIDDDTGKAKEEIENLAEEILSLISKS